jgi:hypothetical protein
MKLKRNIKAEKMVEKEKEVLDVIEEELEEEGISLFNNDNVENDYLVLPRDITEEPSQDLGRYFNAFTQQKMWTRTLIGRLSATIKSKQRSLDDVKADVYASLPAKLSVKEKDLKFQTDERAREVLDELFMLQEKLNMLSDYLENLVDGIFNISREISRRSSDWDDDKRSDNINKKRR